MTRQNASREHIKKIVGKRFPTTLDSDGDKTSGVKTDGVKKRHIQFILTRCALTFVKSFVPTPSAAPSARYCTESTGIFWN